MNRNLSVLLACRSAAVKDPNSNAHVPQHFLYFLPLPQGQGSFLPVFGVALLIWEGAAGFSLEFGAA